MALTENEIQSQWRKAVDIVHQTYVFGDTLAGAAQEFEVLASALKGQFTTELLATWSAQFRAGLSDLVSPARIFDAIAPCILDYGKVLQIADSIGSNYETVEELLGAIFEHFAAGSERVESRVIVLDVTQTVTGTGDGEISRLVIDSDGFQMESVTVEKKVFRCRRDQNSGVKKHAEEFELIGETRSRDDLEIVTHGSGGLVLLSLKNRHGGGGAQGSLLRNSSFSTYDTTATNKFTNWVKVSGTEAIQSTGLSYATFPGADKDESMLMGVAAASGTARYKQTILNMRVTQLNPNRPYFLRAMVNRDDGPGAQGTGGSFVLHLGDEMVSLPLGSFAAGWNEVFIPLNADCWFKNFALGVTSDDFDVEIEWTGWVSGDLLIDDLILCELVPLDGTWWVSRMNDPSPTAWVVDDEVAFTDTQADDTAGKINYNLWRAGLPYLPHDTLGSGNITFADP